MTNLEYMAASGLAYNDFDSLSNLPWTIRELAIAGKIDGFSINAQTDVITVTKTELDALKTMLDWTLVNSQSNTTTGFAGVAIQAPPDSSNNPGELVVAYRGTEDKTADKLLQDMLTDLQIAIQGSTTSQPNQFDDAFDFFTETLTQLGPGAYNGYSFTGHSLGGAMAQYLTYETNNTGPSVTFNAPGIGKTLDGVSNYSQFQVTDYVNENDIIGTFGQQLGSTIYLQDSYPNNYTSQDIDNMAMWYGVLSAVGLNYISTSVGAVLLAEISKIMNGPSDTLIEDIMFGAHGLGDILQTSGGGYSLTDEATSGSNVTAIVSALELHSNGAAFTIDSITYATVFADSTRRVAYAIVDGTIHFLVTVGDITTEFFYFLGATATEIAYQTAKAIEYIGDSVAEAAWNAWDYMFNATHVMTGTTSVDSITGWANKNNIIDGLAGSDTIYGNNFDDMIRGGDGDDTIRASYGDDFVYGEADNDTLQGNDGNDYIFGGEGNDTLYGDTFSSSMAWGEEYTGLGNDILDGGTGNDTLFGGAGNDTYKFGIGGGQDVILDHTGVDTISFLSGVSPADIKVHRREPYNLEFRIIGTSDKITVQNYFYNNPIEKVTFTDGTTWNETAIREMAQHVNEYSYGNSMPGYDDQADIIQGTNADDLIESRSGNDTINGAGGNDTIQGGNGDDIINGGTGNDVLYGDTYYTNVIGGYYTGNGNDTLNGGTGDDTLYGGAGDDTYIFGLGYGKDVVVEHGGSDTISFLTGIAPEDIKLQRRGDSLELKVLNSIDKITISGYFYDSNSPIEKVIFADNTIWDEATLREMARHIDEPTNLGGTTYQGYDNQNDIVTASNGNDTIFTGYGNDNIDAKGGNDNVQGADGNDIVVGGAGDDTLYGDRYYYSMAWGEEYSGTGNDTLDGGTGNDFLAGGSGDDTYIFGLGYGQDTILEHGGSDTISFLTGVTPNDIKLQRRGDSLELSIIGTTDKLTISSYFSSNARAVENVVFDDSTVWDETTLREMARQIDEPTSPGSTTYQGYDNQNDIIQADSNDNTINTGYGDDVINAKAGDDTVTGGYGNDTLIGGDGNDNLYGDNYSYSPVWGGSYSGTGNDILDGGAGNDSAAGGLGDDIYIFGAGYGQDTIFDHGGFDTVLFKQGVAPEDVVVSRVNSTLILSLVGSNDQLTLQDFFSSNPTYTIEEVRFSDTNETVWSLQDLIDKARFINGTSGDDYLSGYENQNDVINLGDGNDTLSSAFSGNDTIHAGAGNDNVTGGNGDDEIHGDEGDDILYGDHSPNYSYLQIGNDILDGGTGNDQLVGGAGDDTYIFGIGYGQDIIEDRHYQYNSSNGGFDNVLLKEGIEPEDVIISRSSNDLVLSIAGTNDRLTIQSYFSKNSNGDYIYAIEEIRFSNTTETIWNFQEILERARTINGTSSDDYLSGFENQDDIINLSGGNDTLYNAYSGNDVVQAGAGDDNVTGGAGDDILRGEEGNDTLYGDFSPNYSYSQIGNDTLDGGAGNDQLFGGAGDDTYLFDLGDGQDIIEDRHWQYGNGAYYNGGIDTIVFGEGVDPENVKIARNGNNLIFTIANTTDSLTVQNFFIKNYSNEYVYAIEEVHFSDSNETVWDMAKLIEDARFINGTNSDDYLGGFENQNDVVTLGDGNDTLYNAYSGNDVIYGGNGNDDITGGSDDDTLYGEAGNDVLYGDFSPNYSYQQNGSDTLDGGAGNDMLYGGGGNDTYVFGLGYGQDLIEDRHLQYGNGAYYNGGTDTIQFKEGVNPEDVKIVRNGNNLTFTIVNTTDSLTVQNFFTKNYSGEYVYAIEEVKFADTNETTWDVAKLIEDVRFINGTNGDDYIGGFEDQNDVVNLGDGNDTLYNSFGGNDVIHAGNGNDNITGGAGNDSLYGEAGNDSLYGDFSPHYSYNQLGADILDGGTGNDALYGGTGNDTYIFGLGYGQDTIEDRDWQYGNGSYYNGGFDTISFKEGIEPEDVAVVRNGNNLVLSVLGTTDSLTVQGFFTKNYSSEYVYAIEEVKFADTDETIWTAADLLEKARHINGTSGNDYIYGPDDQDNIISTGAGNDGIVTFGRNDQLNGGTGNDELYGGYGNDTYVFANGDGNDTITDESGNDTAIFNQNLSNIIFTQSGSNLQISVAGSTDTVMVNSWYSNNNYKIETIEASGGSTITNSQIEQLIQAMATYSSNNNGISWKDALSSNSQDVQNILTQYWTTPSA